MGNLKVGDKVRSLVTQMDVRAGELYEVKTVSDGDVWVIDDVGDNWYLTSEEFEILPVAAKAPEDKPAFKVGDRVRLTIDEGEGRNSGSIGVIEEIKNNYARVLFDAPFDGWGKTGRNWHAQLSDLVVAPLKIEAGKYYRTRDGRKAGPMEIWPLGGWHSDRAEYPLNGGVWLQDGSAKYHGAKDSPQLISEWVDEPVKAAAPVAVQQDAPDLTLKVSFDTADITNAIKTTLLKTKQGYGFEIARHGEPVWVDTGQKAPIVLKSTDVQAAA